MILFHGTVVAKLFYIPSSQEVFGTWTTVAWRAKRGRNIGTVGARLSLRFITSDISRLARRINLC